MKETRLIDRVRYQFDNYMSRGTGALIGALAVISLLLILAAALLITLGNLRQADTMQGVPFQEAFWQTLLHSIDTGTLANDSSWSMRGVMFGVTLGGIFILSALISVLSNGLDDRLDELRKGRSRIIESDHTIILGWSAQIFPILAELAIVNEGKRKACIAIMANKDKLEMEDEIKSRLENTGGMRIVCRSGDPMDLTDLEIVSPNTARSIIVLATNPQYHDADVLKTVLALTGSPHRRPEPYHIVGSLRNPESQEVAQLIVSRGEASLFQVDNLIARITAQTCRQTGLSVVYEELLDFAADGIYFKHEPGLTGKTFGEALFCFEDAALIGLTSQEAGVRLAPALESIIKPGDQVIAIAKGGNSIHPSRGSDYKINLPAISIAPPVPRKPERTLILGWNVRGPQIIEYLDNYAAPGSEVQVVTSFGEPEVDIAQLSQRITNQNVVIQRANTFKRQLLESLQVESFNHIILLSYVPYQEAQRADSITMITLLHLRDIANKIGHPLPMVSEIMDVRNRDLIQVARVDDFIISDRLVSLALTQLSENKLVLKVFQDLFNPEGSEIYLKPVEAYLRLDQPVNFYTVLEAARQRGEVAIGYRLQSEANEADNHYGVHLNPQKFHMITFSQGDRIITLAEQQ
jgi:voltage-gated potassium channel Kch